MGDGKWQAQHRKSANKYAGRYSDASKERLTRAESSLIVSLRKEENSAIRGYDRETQDFHLDTLKELRQQYAEIQRERKRRNESTLDWGFQGYSDAVDDLEITTNGLLRTDDAYRANLTYGILNNAEYAINKELANKNPMGNTKRLNEQLQRIQDLKKRITDKFA